MRLKPPSSMTVHQRLRPLRIGFLVDPSDGESIELAVKANTSLWGGMYNPLIPVFGTTPKWILEDPWERHTSSSLITQGYLRTFEPDILVSVTPGLGNGLEIDQSRLVPFEAVGSWPDRLGSVGLSVRNLYKELSKEYRPLIHGLNPYIVYPVASDPDLDLLVKTFYGDFASDVVGSALSMTYRADFGAGRPRIDADDFVDWVLSPHGYPLKTGSAGLKVDWTYSTVGTVVLLLDPTNPGDILGFWNLRALGRQILPIPRHYSEKTLDRYVRFITDSEATFPTKNVPSSSVSLMKADSVPVDDFRLFVDAVNDQSGTHLRGESYPRFWQVDAARFGHFRHDITADRSSAVCRVENGRTAISTISPSFVDRDSIGFGVQWVNVLELSFPEPASDLAELFPYDMRNMGGLFRSRSIERVFGASREGIVVGISSSELSLDWSVPDGLSAFKAWLHQKGFHAELSPAGRITTQLLKSIGGLANIVAFANSGMLNLLDSMAHGMVEVPTSHERTNARKPTTRARIIGRDRLLGELRRIFNGDAERADVHLRFLVDTGVLRLGLRVDCPECGQWTWYSLADVNDRLRCERCLSDYDFPAIAPPKDIWYYRTQGPFSVENYAQGGYATALALRFLNNLGHYRTTWIPSILGPDLEADFAMWWQRSSGGPTPKMIWGECKSFNKFEAKDVQRARRLINQFPGSVFVFATLRESLTKGEKRRIGALAKAGRKAWGVEWRKAPVMVLTGKELLTVKQVPECWAGADGRFEEIFMKYKTERPGLLELCDATQELHLDMESYVEWAQLEWDRQYNRRRRPSQSKGKREKQGEEP